MDPATLTIISTGLQLGAKLAESKAASRAANLEAQAAGLRREEALFERQLAEARGAQESMNLQEEADLVRGQNLAAFVGDAYSSGSFLALRDKNKEDTDRAILNVKLQQALGMTAASSSAMQAEIMRSGALASASSAKTAGFLGAARAGISGGLQLEKLRS
jgi:hypothetical protein